MSRPVIVAVDPRLPHWFGWVERVPFLRTIIREPLYFLDAVAKLERC